MARYYGPLCLAQRGRITLSNVAHRMTMLCRCASNAAFLFLSLLVACSSAFSQEPQLPASEIPIERCDVLPVVKVRIDTADMRFLLDTAATTVLNLKSFSSGRSKEIKISSWTRTAATSAREVSLLELA